MVVVRSTGAQLTPAMDGVKRRKPGDVHLAMSISSIAHKRYKYNDDSYNGEPGGTFFGSIKQIIIHAMKHGTLREDGSSICASKSIKPQ